MADGTGGRSVEARILAYLGSSDRGPLRARDLARALNVSDDAYRRFKRVLAGLARAGKVHRVEGRRYALPGSSDVIVGIAELTRGGDAFVRPDGGRDDVFVAGVDLATAMDGDRVAVRIVARPRKRSPAGRVVRVVERSRARVVGTLHRGRGRSHVVPLDRRVGQDVLVGEDDTGGAEDGDVVVVRYLRYGDRAGEPPVGTVEEVLGPLSAPGVDVLAVAHAYGLALEFPPEVLDAAQRSAARGMEEPGEGRVDRTNLLVLTIDPADAQDHDDALSVRELKDGSCEVGIHIADVAHFVPEGGPVDIEALARGTSVYLVDRTIPMLPERLSGDVCSLRAGVERFAVSLFVTLDVHGRVLRHSFERTLIRSRKRLSYEEVQRVLDGRASVAPDIDAVLRRLDDQARPLRAARSDRGALDLDLPEARVILDAAGRPRDVQRVERLGSHRLVEDFMILANEVVAREAEAWGLPVPFRVHEPPRKDRNEELADFVRRLGHRLPHRGRPSPRDVQALLASVAGRAEEDLVATVVLRSLERARYDPDNLGHFGLASGAYLHFTSPIRRYPDLVVHREVVRSLVEGAPPRRRDPDELRSVSENASARERAADEAARDSVAMKKVEFMERHLGDELDGRISGVQSFGFFVTLDDFFVDGLVHVGALRDDFYRLQEGAYALVGDRGRRRYRLGDRVRVRVARVDKEARHVDFVLVRKV